MPPPEIRRAGPSDWEAIKAICADTGRQGEPVDDEEREAFSEHWIAPYRELRPDWTMVAVVDQKVIGYRTGCPDTLSFEKERRRVFRPQPDSRDLFPVDIRLKLWTEHPAHLHMNVSADFRGMGAGAGLLKAYIAELKKAGISSAHVICGPAAAAYWERMSFRTAAIVEAAPGINLSALTRAVD